MGRPERIRVPVRFPPTSHKMVAAAAEREGLSMSEYVREAALMRMAWELAAQHGRGADLADVAAALRELRDELRAERRADQNDETPPPG